MARRRAREFALQALYGADVRALSAQGALNDLWSGMLDDQGIDDAARAPESEEIEFAQALVAGVLEDRDALDELVETCSTNWRVSRMPVVDRNILRLAAFELKHRADIPATVSMNEAIELAKTFGTADSRAFVNGIVDRLARQLGRVDASRRKPSGRG